MGLEVFNFIDSLVTTNPVGATDPKSQGDDHIRGVKTTLVNSFPNITGAMNLSQTVLNNLVDAAIKDEANVFTLTNTFASILADDYDGILAANLVDKSAAETIAGAWDFAAITATTYDGIAAANLVDKTAVETIAATWNFSAITATTYDGVAAANLVDKSAVETIVATWNFAAITAVSYDGILATNLLGEITAINTAVVNSNAAQPGYKGSPQNIQNANYTLLLTDVGKQIYKASGGAGETITIPANASVAFPIGTIIVIINDGGGDLTIAITTDTLEKFDDVTGSQTLPDNNKAVIEKVTATLWKYSASA